MVHSMDRHSNKSALLPPGLVELEKLAQQARTPPSGPALLESAGTPTRSLRRRLAPQVIEELIIRYTAGEAIRALSREYSVSRSGLRQLLQGEGVALRKQGITPEDAKNAVRLYETGLTITQVVERIGYSYYAIRTMLHEQGVALRAPGRGRRVTSPVRARRCPQDQ